MIYIVLSSLETVHDTVQVLYFFIALSSLEDEAKHQNLIRTREKVQFKCTM